MNLYEANSQWNRRPQDQRFQTLGDLAKSVEARRMLSRSEVVSPSAISFAASCNIGASSGEPTVLVGASQQFKSTHHSFGQVCQLAGAPAGYLRKLPVDLAVQNLNHSIGGRVEDVKLLTLQNGESILQAVTGPQYGRIWDADVVAAVQRIVDRTDGKFYNPKDWSGNPSGLYASDHDVFCFMIDGCSIVDGGTDRDQMNRGFIVWNSETGSRQFGLMTFLFRVVCGNHIIWDASNVNKLMIRHSKNAPGRFDTEALPMLVEYVNSSAGKTEEAIKAARHYAIPQEVENLMKQFPQMSRAEILGGIQKANEEEGQCATLWDLVNGLTAYARGFDYIDARVDLERRAGQLMQVVS